MAALKTIDLSGQLLCDHAPSTDIAAPKQKYTIEEFHSRSNLFPSSCNNRFYTSRKDAKERDAFSHKLGDTSPNKEETVRIEKKYDETARKPPPGKSSSHGRRVKSAKGRIEKASAKPDKIKPTPDRVYGHLLAWENIPDSNDTDEGIDIGMTLAVVPVNGKQVPVVDLGDDAPFPSYDYQDKKSEKHVSSDLKPFLSAAAADSFHISRPSSAKCSSSSQLSDNQEGIRRQRPSSAKKVSEKVPEKQEGVSTKITPSIYGLQNNRQVYGEENTSKVESLNHGTSVYKLSDELPVQKGANHDTSKTSRAVPASLEPLLPWMTTHFTKQDIGIDPQKCLVFLPLLSCSSFSDLPEVPPPHSVDEDLPFKEKIVEPEPIVPKKYDHPSLNKKPVQEWVCQHRRPSTSSYAFDLDEFCKSRRTIGAVRKEIADLERLMQGIGTLDSDCGLVQYQAEIERFRQTYRETMELVPERLRNPPPPPPDTFGLRQFYKEHDEIMLGIRQRHALCLQELADLEVDIGIESDRKYFKHHVIRIPADQA